jgi:hypothetical protein
MHGAWTNNEMQMCAQIVYLDMEDITLALFNGLLPLRESQHTQLDFYPG